LVGWFNTLILYLFNEDCKVGWLVGWLVYGV